MHAQPVVRVSLSLSVSIDSGPSSANGVPSVRVDSECCSGKLGPTPLGNKLGPTPLGNKLGPTPLGNKFEGWASGTNCAS